MSLFHTGPQLIYQFQIVFNQIQFFLGYLLENSTACCHSFSILIKSFEYVFWSQSLIIDSTKIIKQQTFSLWFSWYLFKRNEKNFDICHGGQLVNAGGSTCVTGGWVRRLPRHCWCPLQWQVVDVTDIKVFFHFF